MERVGFCSGGFTLFSLLEILRIALNGFLEGVSQTKIGSLESYGLI